MIRSASQTRSSSRAPASTTCSRRSGWSCQSTGLVVITGPSGSGKSSLAFDTLYAEGQRRYVESLVRVRAAVPRPDGEAEVRAHSRLVADDRDPAKDRGIESALDGWHDRPRSTTTSACSTRVPASSAAISATVRSVRGPRVRSSTSLPSCPRRRRSPCFRRKRRIARASFASCSSSSQKAGFVRVRIDGMIVRLDEVGSGAREAEEALDRIGHRSDHYQQGRQGSVDRLRRDRVARR